MSANESTLKLKHLLIADVAADTMQKRPMFTISLTVGDAEVLKNNIGTADLSEITNAELAKKLQGVLGYASELADPLPIPGGWDTPRCAFNMVLECGVFNGLAIEFFVSGFTNRRPQHTSLKNKEVDWTGVDFYVNYIAALRVIQNKTDPEAYRVFNVASSELLISARDENPDAKFTFNRIRPVDVFSILTRPDLFGLPNDVVDHRTLVTNQGVFSKREHSIPVVWFGDILRSYAQALQLDVLGRSSHEVLSNARSMTMESSPLQNVFLRAVSQPDGLNQSRVSIETLRHLFPNFDDVGTYAADEEINETSYVEGKKEWHAPALLAGLGTTALMGALGLVMIQFSAEKAAGSGQLEIVVTNAVSVFSEARSEDVGEIIDAFKARFAEEIVPEISRNNLQPFKVSITAHIGAFTQVVMGSGDEYPHVRTIASYADSLLTPLVYSEDQKNEEAKLVQDTQTLLDTLLETPLFVPNPRGSI